MLQWNSFPDSECLHLAKRNDRKAATQARGLLFLFSLRSIPLLGTRGLDADSATGPRLCDWAPLSPFLRNAASASMPPAEGSCWGSPLPFSLPPFAITIYLSLEVEGTRACNWERLVEPERESEEASVWAPCLPKTGKGEKEAASL